MQFTFTLSLSYFLLIDLYKKESDNYLSLSFFSVANIHLFFLISTGVYYCHYLYSMFFFNDYKVYIIVFNPDTSNPCFTPWLFINQFDALREISQRIDRIFEYTLKSHSSLRRRQFTGYVKNYVANISLSFRQYYQFVLIRHNYRLSPVQENRKNSQRTFPLRI